jgi:hypothetical protein
MRRVLHAIFGLALLAGCGARPAASELPVASTTASTTAVPEVRCSAEGVTFVAAGSDAAMGIRVLTIEMVNCGTSPYTVEGYPRVRLFDEDHEPVEVEVAQGSAGIASVPAFDDPPEPVTLRPGEKAAAGLLWRNLVTDATVPATTATYLEAAPARGRPWQPVPQPVTIDLGNTGRLGVGAWRKV